MVDTSAPLEENSTNDDTPDIKRLDGKLKFLTLSQTLRVTCNNWKVIPTQDISLFRLALKQLSNALLNCFDQLPLFSPLILALLR